MERLGAVVNHHLLAREVGVAERRCHIQDRPRSEGADLVKRGPPLEVNEREREERRVKRHNRQRRRTVREAPRLERDHNELLCAQPRECLCLDPIKALAKTVRIPRLVRGARIRNHHARGVPAAHVILGIVDGDTVAAARHCCFRDHLTARRVIDREHGAALGTEGELVELITARRNDHSRTCQDRLTHRRRDVDRGEHRVEQGGGVGCGGLSRNGVHGRAPLGGARHQPRRPILYAEFAVSRALPNGT